MRPSAMRAKGGTTTATRASNFAYGTVPLVSRGPPQKSTPEKREYASSGGGGANAWYCAYFIGLYETGPHSKV